MFKNYIKIAWRNIKVNRLFSLINIIGLSIGLAIVILLFLFISHEQSFDTMFPNKDRIHRVLVETDGDFGYETWASTPPVVASSLQKEVTNVEKAARMLKHDFGGTASLRVNDENFTEDRFYWVDKELLSIFDISILKGDKVGALDRPNTVIISETTAQMYFGNDNPVGQVLLVDGSRKLEVTGVYKDFPENSTLDADVMASSNGYWFYENTSWSNSSFETYCLLKKNVSLEATLIQVSQMLDANVSKENQWYSLSLQPLSNVHLHSASFGNTYTSRVGDINEVRNLGYLAVLILLIACMNYMNLTTARSQKRSKEVGISKTLGATSGSLVGRFYMETGLITVISIVLGLLLATMVLPAFNALTDQELKFDLLLTGKFFAVLCVIWVITTFISGIYPALYLSRFLPKEILSPSLKQGKGNMAVRKGLVVLQFAASASLIVGVLVIYQQTQFIQNKNLGFAPENVMAISVRGLRGMENQSAMVQELKSLTDVTSVAMAQGYPSVDVSGRTLKKNQSDEHGLNIQTNVADAEIIDVLNLKLLAGQGLPIHKSEGDTLVEVVLNKKAIDYLGFSPEEAIGKEVYIGVPNTIVGVLNDFNYESLRQPIGAYAFHNNTSEGKSFMLVRFKSGNISNTLSGLKMAFNKVAPDLDFDYIFLDQNLENLYAREKRAGQISIVFCILAIFVAALGLFGLAAFTAEQRRKEIGIRKVLGASVASVAQMLSKDFAKLVFIALLCGFPLAYWLMENWLEGFAYRIQIQWWVFVISAIVALGIALLTVSFQSIRAALTNPVKSLRTE
ncbi:ABC transporter permease [Maribacter sp. PR1]|uniref:ABC transporter permease n=1 Tax=Maribacter cobaltidurans TaxID=1178778 RepID=A0ABU7ISL8_9FLAO|nr:MULTISPECIES: ABC transporter permease [Maribacter]MDC6388230.1 ABC transporter permease [Maribacter sp. PR1]MEE1975618.1 ABC transporter permease [Maribacter cobaltidurans]